VQIKNNAVLMSSIASEISFTTRLNASVCSEQINYHAERVSGAAFLARAPIVFVIDDDVTNTRSIETFLCSRGYAVRAFDSAASFLRSIDASTPGCVLLNLRLPDATGLGVQTYLAATGRAQPVVFLSSCGTVRAAVQAIKGGAEDFIEMPFEETVLVGAVERAIERDRRQRARRLERDLHAARLELLTPRELQVLGHVIAGRLNKQIAARLGATEKTIKVHRARMMHKMSVRSVAELTRLADQLGVQPEA
jgi:FixJ family two-component response regulator